MYVSFTALETAARIRQWIGICSSGSMMYMMAVCNTMVQIHNETGELSNTQEKHAVIAISVTAALFVAAGLVHTVVAIMEKIHYRTRGIAGICLPGSVTAMAIGFVTWVIVAW